MTFYQFDKFLDDIRMEVTKYQTSLKQTIDITTATFYIGRFLIHPRYIPEGSFLNNYEGSNFLVEPSDQLSLLQICEVSSKGIINCRAVDMKMKERTLKMKNLLYVNSETSVQKEAAHKLVGEYVMYVKKEKKHLLMLGEKELWMKSNTKDLKWDKIGLSYIISIQEGLVWVYLPDGQPAYSSYPIFCLINRIDLKINPQSFIGKEMKIFEVNGKHCFKLKGFKQKSAQKLIIQGFNNDFTPENESELKYPKSRPLNRIQCTDFEEVLQRDEFNTKDYFISQASINKNLASVIGLGIIEHLIRFKRDIAFKTFIEKTFERANINTTYADFNLLFSSKSVKEFHEKLGENAKNIKRIGEGLLSLSKNDVETFEGLQELCDIIGCCIHLRNFTEGFKQLKIVPTHYEIKRRPIINLGKYFNSYFLIYSEEIMIADGFKKGQFEEKRNFPYYDEDFIKEETLLSDFIKGLIKRIDEIKECLEKKLSGKNFIDQSYDFAKEVKLYKDYFYEKYNDKLDGDVAKKLKNLNFDDIFYNISGKNYFCNCGCNQYFNHATEPKKTCICKKDYSRPHLLNLNGNTSCFCQNYRVQDILALT